MRRDDGSANRLSVRTQAQVTLTNLGLASVKLGVGFLAGSPALIANGAENLTDLLSNAVAWIGHRAAQAPPDEDHHYGHGNAEGLAAIGIGLLILGAGAGIVYRTLTTGGAAEPGFVGALALAAAVLSAIVCELLSRHVHRVAARLGSQILAALARDKRSDALTSLVVVAGVGGSLLGVGWLEPIVAALMGCLIAYLGLRSVLEGLDVLMDRVSDPRIREELRQVASGVAGVRGVEGVRVHPLGTTWRVDLEIGVDGGLTVREGHDIAHAVQEAILEQKDRVVEVQVHVNPL